MLYINPEIFALIVVLFKLLGTFLAAIVALINHKIDYIVKYPNNLVQDALMLSTSVIISVVLIELLRIGTVRISHITQLFFLIFTFSVLRELSGYFDFVENKNLNEQQQKQRKPLFIMVGIIFGSMIIFGSLIALNNFIIPVKNMFNVYNTTSKQPAWPLFLLETIGVVLLSVPAEVFITLRHHDIDNKVLLIAVTSLSIALFHVGCQLSGVYSLLI
jgi:hypothetical protein